jgi:hypothetical protein
MEEENKIQDGEIISSEEPVKEIKRKRKRTDLYIELVLFFILGILIGITLKTEAEKRITIGYNDYQMSINKQDYNINQLQNDLVKKSAEQNSSTENSNTQDEQAPSDQTQDNQGSSVPENSAENPQPVAN